MYTEPTTATGSESSTTGTTTIAGTRIIGRRTPGRNSGRCASGTAIQTIAEHIGETIGCFYSQDVEREHEFLTQLQNAVERSHQQVGGHPCDLTRITVGHHCDTGQL